MADCMPLLSGEALAIALVVRIMHESEAVDILDELRIEVGFLIGPVLRTARSRKRTL